MFVLLVDVVAKFIDAGVSQSHPTASCLRAAECTNANLHHSVVGKPSNAVDFAVVQ
jgi:hypothetical protein